MYVHMYWRLHKTDRIGNSCGKNNQQFAAFFNSIASFGEDSNEL